MAARSSAFQPLPAARMRTVAPFAAGFVVIVGVLVLAGWVLEVGLLKGPVPGLVQMKANAAICFVALGCGLLLTIAEPSVGRRRVARALVGLVVAIGVLTLAEYLLGRNLGIDELLFRDARAVHTVHPGRLAPQSAVIFVFLGFALAFVTQPGGKRSRLVGLLTGMSFVIALCAVIGYAYGASELSGVPGFTPIPLYTAVTFLVVCAGIAAADPKGVFVEVLTSGAMGSVAARRLLPACIVVFPLFGWAGLEGERRGLYSGTTGVALFVLVSTLAVTVAVLSLAKRLNRVDVERRAAAATAERAAYELAAQQELAVELIATIGFDGHFKRVNVAWERTFGYTAEELMSRPFIEYVHPEDRLRTEAGAAELAQGVDIICFQNRYRTKAGSWRWLEWNVRPGVEEGMMYCVARDVTDRKRGEDELAVAKEEAERAREDAEVARVAAEQANHAKSEFLSRMSHELRTPLSAILGFGQLLEMDELDRGQRDSVGQILSGGRHLLGLIDEVLDISRIEAQTMRLSLESVDLRSALGDAAGMVAPLASQSGIELLTEITSGGADECYVRADRQRLRQVILNVLSNAVKYNRPGGRVTVSLARDGDMVALKIADTGPGIPADKLARLFVAFDRLGAEQGGVEGTGLGLALSKSLVEEMGGAISAESLPGHGTVFSIELPIAANPVDETILARAREIGAASSSLGPRKILYIEDNPSNAKLVVQAFASQPEVQVMVAMQGSHGVELARGHHPDLVLLDLHLPDMHGSAVLDMLSEDPATSEIPVIVLSADATQRQVRDLLARGACAYLTKPLDIREFLEVVDQHLRPRVSANV